MHLQSGLRHPWLDFYDFPGFIDIEKGLPLVLVKKLPQKQLSVRVNFEENPVTAFRKLLIQVSR